MRFAIPASCLPARLAAASVAGLLLLACTPMNQSTSTANAADGGLQPLDIPDQGVAKQAPSRFVWNVLIMSSSERARDCEADASAWRTADS